MKRILSAVVVIVALCAQFIYCKPIDEQSTEIDGSPKCKSILINISEKLNFTDDIIDMLENKEVEDKENLIKSK
mgnify:CR=1 FL=1